MHAVTIQQTKLIDGQLATGVAPTTHKQHDHAHHNIRHHGGMQGGTIALISDHCPTAQSSV